MAKLSTWEALSRAVDPIGAKAYAQFTGRSYGHIKKQCCPPQKNGRRNFIDKIVSILHENLKPGMEDIYVFRCICEEFGYEATESTVTQAQLEEALEYLAQCMKDGQGTLPGVVEDIIKKAKRGRRK